MQHFVRSALLLGLVLLCTATVGHSLPAVSNQAAQVFAQLQKHHPSPINPYARLLSDRTKRGLFSSLAGFATNAGVAAVNKDPDADESPSNKPKPYDFNEVEMTAIQAMISLRDIIGELLQKVGFNIPSLASLITRSESGVDKTITSDSSSSPLGALTSTKSTNVGMQVLRGLALLSPLIIPMATQIRRMSPDTSSSMAAMPAIPIPQMPVIPDYWNYNAAMHRRRGKRSLNLRHDQKWASAMTVPALRGAAVQHLLSSRPILRYLRQMEAQFAKSAK